MYSFKISFEGIDNTNQYDELIKVFLQPSEYELVPSGESADMIFSFKGDKNQLKREIYETLSSLTHKHPKWGILTGIRPVKLAGDYYSRLKDYNEVAGTMEREYLLDTSKSQLITEILRYQLDKLGKPAANSLSVYIGIPFCPTRCLYCSFTSNQVENSEIERYLDALHREISATGAAAKEEGFRIESVYIGGGTPTTLSSCQLDELLNSVEEAFDLSHIKEFTVECGRPDTITADKLKVLGEHNIDRISINPQTMKESTLELIGRRHTVNQVSEAFELCEDKGIRVINADLIAGLPDESVEDFRNSLDEIVRMGAGNITLHTLAVKRASRLKEVDENFNYKREETCGEMLTYAETKLRSSGYVPYYLYRQKHTSGNTENIGYCKAGEISVYNVRIMEEEQSILALGAGGISKIYFPETNRLERVANVSNYEIYIDRIDEMIERKNKGFFGVRYNGGK
ncbi:MAG: coproporphyrinogen dehydrogenase HemZ [Bacillota bacterium]|nr:coproporphyrinogen dehydrogenase HemZ [Bacillota bacterium]